MWDFDQSERGEGKEISEREAAAWMLDLMGAVNDGPRAGGLEIALKSCSPARREGHRQQALRQLAESYERDTDAARAARSYALARLAEWSE